MDTYTIDEKIITDYTGWPLTCWHCGSDKVIYSQLKNDTRCQVCKEWQLTEEDE